MNSAVLVTGARGFIGRHLVRLLNDRGYAVLEPDLPGEIEAGLNCAGQCGHVIHLAAKSHVPDSWADPAAFYRTNFAGTVQVLEFCRRTGASLTFVSSYLYGQAETLPTSEDEPLRPGSPYAHSKYLAEDAVRFYGNHLQVGYTIVRPFNIYGPGLSPKAFISELFRKYLAPETAEITILDGRPARDYLYVSDFVDLLQRTIGRAGGEIFNAGSGVAYSPADVVRQIEVSLGIQKPIRVLGETRRNEILATQADITRARDLLAWVPRVSFAAGIAMTAASIVGRER